MLEVRDVPAPALGDSDVMIRVRAASLHAGDYFLAVGVPWLARTAVGVPKPRASS